MQSVVIGSNQAGQRLDKFLHKYLPQAGTGFLYKMLRKKNITLNGKKAEGSEILALNDKVCFFFSDETFAKFSGRETVPVADSKTKQLIKEYEKAYKTLQGITVLYEDENILALNKPAGVLTQKAKPEDISLNEWMIGYLLKRNPALSKELTTFKPSVCNRLDRNTGGIVLCGKSMAGLQYLSRCIKERTIGKFYRTICAGRLTKAERVEGYLTKNHAKNQVTITTKKPLDEEGTLIQTAYKPLVTGEKYTLLEVELITGKTHQIRAHLASIGHPLIGDFKYGEEETNQNLKKKYGLEYQLLHAYRVEFGEDASPIGQALKGMVITAPYSKAFVHIQEALGLPER